MPTPRASTPDARTLLAGYSARPSARAAAKVAQDAVQAFGNAPPEDLAEDVRSTLQTEHRPAFNSALYEALDAAGHPVNGYPGVALMERFGGGSHIDVLPSGSSVTTAPADHAMPLRNSLRLVPMSSHVSGGPSSRAQAAAADRAVAPHVAIDMVDGTPPAHVAVDMVDGTPPAHVAVDMVEDDPALIPAARTLDELQAQVEAEQQRPIDVGRLAIILKDVRAYGPGAADPASERALNARQLINGISPSQRQTWYAALGISEEEQARMNAQARLSGLFNPTGALVSNVLNYVVGPIISTATGNPWAGTGFSLGVAFVLQAAINAKQQTAVVALGEHQRNRAFNTILDKKGINDSQRVSEAIAHTEADTANLGAAHEALADRVLELANKYDIPTTTAPDAPLPLDDAGFEALISAATPEERGQIDLLGAKVGEAMDALTGKMTKLLSTEGSVYRQWIGNFVQMLPRSLRSPVSNWMSLLRGPNASSKLAGMPGYRPERLTAWGGVGAQIGLTGLFHVGQMTASAIDEQRKQSTNNDLNMLFADVLTPEGANHWARTGEIRPGDLDERKLRGLHQAPAAAIAKRLEATIKALRVEAETERDRILAAAVPATATAAISTADAIEEGRGATELSGRQQAQLDELERAIASLKDDEAKVGANRLVALSPNGLARGMLEGTLGGNVGYKFLMQDARQKYRAPAEFSSQFMQRLGSMLNGIVLGTAVSSTVGKVVTTLNGGSSTTPTNTIAGMGVLSLALSTFGSATQHIMISEKNNRRENPKTVDWKDQLKRSIAAPYNVVNNVLSQDRVTQAAYRQMDQARQLHGLATRPRTHFH